MNTVGHTINDLVEYTELYILIWGIILTSMFVVIEENFIHSKRIIGPFRIQ